MANAAAHQTRNSIAPAIALVAPIRPVPGLSATAAYEAALSHLERAADHLTNVCERIVYMKTGELRELIAWLKTAFDGAPPDAVAAGGKLVHADADGPWLWDALFGGAGHGWRAKEHGFDFAITPDGDEVLGPDLLTALIDIATLTGACVVALGQFAIGMFGTDANLKESIREAGIDTVNAGEVLLRTGKKSDDFFFPWDRHPNRDANDVLAVYLVERLKR